MRTSILLSALLLCCGPAVRAQTAAPKENTDIKVLYDKAFSFYVTGDYPKAIEQWNLVLAADPKQTTARNMIEEARKKIAGSSVNLSNSLNSLLQKGRYADALIKLEEMLAADQTTPYYLKLQGRLGKISAMVPAKPSASKAWNAASEGISAG